MSIFEIQKPRLSRDQVASKLNPYLLELVTLPRECNVRRVAATDLLSIHRLDILAKYVYAKFYIRGIKGGWPLELYREHLRTFNQFKEIDYSGKSSFTDFVKSFDAVIESIQGNGFLPNQSILPVTLNGVIIDGSHRVAACLALNKELTIAEIDYDANSYDAQYFAGSGLASEHLESMIFEFIRLKKNVKVAVLFPAATDRFSEVLQLVKNKSEILYTKHVTLTEIGKINFVRTIYSEENWTKAGSKDSLALLATVDERFGNHDHVHCIFFEENDLVIARQYKETVRSWFDLGNLPIHISDYHTETLRLAEIILNENGLEWLNHCSGKRFERFDRLLRTFRDQLEDDVRDCVLLDGSSTLAAFGLRDANDIDYLSMAGSLGISVASSHDDELIYHTLTKEDLILNPRHYFWFEGIKLISVRDLRAMKANRGESKDQVDVMLIDGLLDLKSAKAQTFAHYYHKAHFFLASLQSQFRTILSKYLPTRVKQLILSAIEVPFRISESIGPIERSMEYRGFCLHYPRGASLIRRIKGGRYFEPKVASAIVNHLCIYPNGSFLDVGANIGLMTLNVLSKLPGTSIVAFEPGPTQLEYFEKTIHANHLGSQICVVPLALSNKIGTACFSVHGDRHSSGDGFFDTGRSGVTSEIEVQTTTLDDWWEKSGKIPVSVIKIDTEGAELWVLQGGRQLIQNEKPAVILEIHATNLQAFPHAPEDIVEFFRGIGYRLESLVGVEVKEANINELMEIDENFVAYPL